MLRCLQLARLGAGAVSPNPMVGAVLVHEGRIIGEGHHAAYGQPHAEVNCIASVNVENQHLIGQSVLYVSLEPCAHFGKTPPCADLIVSKQIARVVVACRDPFPEVDGRGIEKLQRAGTEVLVGVLEKEASELNRRFFLSQRLHRPYVILKWAQSINGNIAALDSSRVQISNPISNRLVHKWRSQEDAILVGTTTALVDDPALTVRLWKGRDPLRLVLDLDLRLPGHLKIFEPHGKIVVFNRLKDEQRGNCRFYKLKDEGNLVAEMLTAMHNLEIQSVLVEGGARLLQSFIDSGCWDEARVISSGLLYISKGLAAPSLHGADLRNRAKIMSDSIDYYRNHQNSQ